MKNCFKDWSQSSLYGEHRACTQHCFFYLDVFLIIFCTCCHALVLTLSMLAAISVVCLLITFANTKLDPDQDPRYVGPDLDPNRLALFDTACLIR